MTKEQEVQETINKLTELGVPLEWQAVIVAVLAGGIFYLNWYGIKQALIHLADKDYKKAALWILVISTLLF